MGAVAMGAVAVVPMDPCPSSRQKIRMKVSILCGGENRARTHPGGSMIKMVSME